MRTARGCSTSRGRRGPRRVVDDLARAHPDLPRKVTRVDLMRYGHAMAIPAPGVRGSAALAALARHRAGRVHFAHSDLAGYSVFEEAFHHGGVAGRAAAAALSARISASISSACTGTPRLSSS